MPIYCGRDGIGHPEDARYCMMCGEPLTRKAVSTTTARAREVEVFRETVEKVHLYSEGRSLTKRLVTVAVTDGSLVLNGLQGPTGSIRRPLQRLLAVEIEPLRSGFLGGGATSYRVVLMGHRRDSSTWWTFFCNTEEQAERLHQAIESTCRNTSRGDPNDRSRCRLH